MLEWVGTHLFWIVVYWSSSFAIILNFYERRIAEKGELTWKVILVVFLVSPAFPWIMGALVLGQFMKAGKDRDDI